MVDQKTYFTLTHKGKQWVRHIITVKRHSNKGYFSVKQMDFALLLQYNEQLKLIGGMNVIKDVPEEMNEKVIIDLLHSVYGKDWEVEFIQKD